MGGWSGRGDDATLPSMADYFSRTCHLTCIRSPTEARATKRDGSRGRGTIASPDQGTCALVQCASIWPGFGNRAYSGETEGVSRVPDLPEGFGAFQTSEPGLLIAKFRLSIACSRVQSTGNIHSTEWTSSKEEILESREFAIP